MSRVILYFLPLCSFFAASGFPADRLSPQWLPGGKVFYYQAESGEFSLIDSKTGIRKTASDLTELGLPEPAPVRSAEATIKPGRSERTGTPSGVRFVNELESEVNLFWIDASGKRNPYGKIAPKSERVQPSYEGHAWVISRVDGSDLATIEAGTTVSTLIIDGEGRKPAILSSVPPGTSPDGVFAVRVEGERLVLTRFADGTETILRAPIKEGATYRGRVFWSPDSRAFLVSAAVEVPERLVTILENGGENPVKTFPYAKPGDPLPNPQLVLFRLGSEEGQVIDASLFPRPFTRSHRIDVTWSPDGSEAYFDYNERGHQCYRILAVEAAGGAVRVVTEERSGTFIDYTAKTWRHWLHGSGEILRMSEHSGWCHLYLHEIATGELKHRVTGGAWPVREVVHVDVEKRRVWFLASGLREGEDPYHRHLCRANFDGSGFVRLTEGDGDHEIAFSPTREWFIDRWSRIDAPPVHELRSSEDGSLVCEIERSAADPGAGPERFVAKGRDGETDIHGIIIRPTGFDAAKAYPVLENIYAGPHSAFVPKSFGSHKALQSLADEGFIVVKIDGMGTNHRGKAFHDVAWKNLKDAGFPDRIVWIKEAAKTRPWMDLSRVGIYGGSAGGQSAMRAVLDYHEFYKVAVADCGCHDNRMDKIWWNEQWMGWPVDESYILNSNADDAHRLGGKLLLIVGELDTNVDPASTTQVVAALQKAGKEFEYMPIIGAGHGAAETPYGSKVRLEFLRRHLRP
jgi:dipeptidyl-peptidase 4